MFRPEDSSDYELSQEKNIQEKDIMLEDLMKDVEEIESKGACSVKKSTPQSPASKRKYEDMSGKTDLSPPPTVSNGSPSGRQEELGVTPAIGSRDIKDIRIDLSEYEEDGHLGHPSLDSPCHGHLGHQAPDSTCPQKWPHLAKFFTCKYHPTLGGSHFKALCQECKPKINEISISTFSLFGVKRHYKSAHPYLYEELILSIRKKRGCTCVLKKGPTEEWKQSQRERVNLHNQEWQEFEKNEKVCRLIQQTSSAVHHISDTPGNYNPLIQADNHQSTKRPMIVHHNTSTSYNVKTCKAPDFLKPYTVFRLNDYLGLRTRQQFWEEPVVQRMLEGIKNKEIDMKSAAELLGVSYGTLYGRYREVFGYLKHTWVNKSGRTLGSVNKECSIWEDAQAQDLIQQVLKNELSFTAAAVKLGVDTNTFFTHITDSDKNKALSTLLLGKDSKENAQREVSKPNQSNTDTNMGIETNGIDCEPEHPTLISEDSNVENSKLGNPTVKSIYSLHSNENQNRMVTFEGQGSSDNFQHAGDPMDGSSGVYCVSKEALGADESGFGGDNDDVDRRPMDDIKLEPEFLHDPLDVKTQVQGSAQAMTSPGLISPPAASPPCLPEHHQTVLPTTGSAATGLTGPYQLKKETHCSTVLDQLLQDETFTDVTLTAEGQSIRAHRVVLCLASAYFRQVLSNDQNVHSVVILRDIKFAELKNIINFIYTGEATVDALELESFMRIAEMLEILSLCDSHKSKSTGGLISQSYGSGFSIGEFESLMGTKRNHNDASPMPSKNRKISGEQFSHPSTPGVSATSVICVKKEPIDHDSNRMHTDEPVYRERGRYNKRILEDSPGYGSRTFSTFDTGEMNTMEEGSNSGGNGKSDASGRSSPSIMMSDITTLPGRCPYCPHLNQEFCAMSMMRHLLVSHPCKPAFPCDNCFRVFVRKSQFSAHQAKCKNV